MHLSIPIIFLLFIYLYYLSTHLPLIIYVSMYLSNAHVYRSAIHKDQDIELT